MTILLSALTRFHVFDLAVQLHRRGMLGKLVTAYPRCLLGKYVELTPAVLSLPRFALAQKAALMVGRLARGKSIASELIYGRFGAAVATAAKRHPASVVYGLSGYMTEVVDKNLVGKSTVVDHGSLHIATERRILQAECERYGFAEFGNWRHKWLVDRMNHEFRSADHVICCSALAADSMIANGVPKAKIFVNRLGVDLSAFSKQARVTRGSRVRRVLFVGAMTPLKGLHHLIAAFHHLDHDTELWLVGNPPTDLVMKSMIEKCAKATGRVRVIGPVRQSYLNSIYNQCDVFVLPSLSDGWGMVVSQAMACGLPVIVSDMTGAKELVKNGINGFVVKSGDSFDLTEKLVRSIEKSRDRSWLEALGNEQHMPGQTWQDFGDRWAEWLQRIVRA